MGPFSWCSGLSLGALVAVPTGFLVKDVVGFLGGSDEDGAFFGGVLAAPIMTGASYLVAGIVKTTELGRAIKTGALFSSVVWSATTACLNWRRNGPRIDPERRKWAVLGSAAGFYLAAQTVLTEGVFPTILPALATYVITRLGE